MALFLIILSIFLASTNAHEDCTTPTQKPGKCVLISHCPHLFSSVVNNKTTNFSKNHVQQSHCGFESIWFPKVCCPIEAIQLHQRIHPSRQASKCGLHVPGGDDDPWLTLLEYEKPDGSRAFLCGGVLIHKKYVLASAHCFEGLRGRVRVINVHFGGYNPKSSEPPMSIQVDGVIVHDAYNPNDPNRSNDVALVRLKKKVSFKNGMIRPICLPTDGGSKIGNILATAGWERTPTGSFKKKAGLATVWNDSRCTAAYNATGFRLGEAQMCAGGENRASPNYGRFDFGEILMEVSGDTSYSLVGITSSRPPCCDKGENPKIYAKVSKYINWIFSNMDL